MVMSEDHGDDFDTTTSIAVGEGVEGTPDGGDVKGAMPPVRDIAPFYGQTILAEIQTSFRPPTQTGPSRLRDARREIRARHRLRVRLSRARRRHCLGCRRAHHRPCSHRRTRCPLRHRPRHGPPSR